MTLLAINRDTNLPIGMISLWPQDGQEWPDKSPWIAAVYTLYRYRGMRIATTLVERILQEAKRFDFDIVYLQAGSAAGMYRKLGFAKLNAEMRVPLPQVMKSCSARICDCGSGGMEFADIIAGLGGQIDGEYRTNPLFAVDDHGAAVALYQMFDDCKTKTGAANGT